MCSVRLSVRPSTIYVCRKYINKTEAESKIISLSRPARRFIASYKSASRGKIPIIPGVYITFTQTGLGQYLVIMYR